MWVGVCTGTSTRRAISKKVENASSGGIFRSRTAELQEMCVVNFDRYCQVALQKGGTALYARQQHVGVSRQHCALSASERLYHVVTLMCLFLVRTEVGYLPASPSLNTHTLFIGRYTQRKVHKALFYIHTHERRVTKQTLEQPSPRSRNRT